MISIIRRTIIALLIINLIGCSSWIATQQPLADLDGKQVRVTMLDGKRVYGRVDLSDSLGVPVLQRPFDRPRSVAIDTALVVGIERKDLSEYRTVALILLIVVPLAVLIGIGISLESSMGSWSASSTQR